MLFIYFIIGMMVAEFSGIRSSILPPESKSSSREQWHYVGSKLLIAAIWPYIAYKILTDED